MPATTPPTVRTGRRSRRGAASWRWAGVGVLMFLLGATWAAAMPVMAGPDEPSHVIWAAAVARGQLSGHRNDAAQDGFRPGAGTLVDLPTDYGPAASLPNCFAFHPENSADCQQDIAAPVPGAVAPTETFAGQYPPLYYALVGWPSLFLDSEAADYGMRLVSAALVAMLITWGLWGLVCAFGRGWASAAAAVAITPMCLFLAGVVNPQSLEIAAAFAFWAACLTLARGPSPAATSTYVLAAVSGALLVNTRATSPLWAAVIVVVALVVAPPGRWRAVLAHRAARWVGATAVMAVAAVAGWLALHPVLTAGPELYPSFRNPLRVLAGAGGHSFEYLVGMIGDFGWLDTPAPPATLSVWLVAGGALLVLAAAARVPLRPRAGLVLLAAAVATLPMVLQVPGAPQIGLIWQGRYTLPIAVGLPLVAVAVLLAAHDDTRDLVRRLLRILVPFLALAHVAAFWWAERRFAQGTGRAILTLTPAWASPLGYLSSVAVYAVLVATATIPAWRAMRSVSAPTVPSGPAEREPVATSATP